MPPRNVSTAVAALVGLACGGGGGEHSPTGPAQASVARISAMPDSAGLLPGQTLQFTATLYDRTNTVVTGPSVTWLSNDAGVAAVSSAGLVEAREAGRAVVTARVGEISGQAVARVGLSGHYTLRRADGQPVPGELTRRPSCSDPTQARYHVYSGNLQFVSGTTDRVNAGLDVLEDCGVSSSRYYSSMPQWTYGVAANVVTFSAFNPQNVVFSTAAVKGDSLILRWKPELSDSMTLHFVRD